jgi:hypothetical protein
LNTKRSLITLGAAIVAMLHSAAAFCDTPAAASAAPPVEAFFDSPLISKPILSPDEDHGLFIRQDKFDFHRREEAFLAANIGSGAVPLAAAEAASATTH